MGKNILALDFGRKTGFAVHAGGKLKQSGTVDLGAKKPYRYKNFHAHVKELIKSHKIKTIYIEQVHRHNGTEAAHQWGGYEAITLLIALKNGCDVHYMGVGQIKKVATGNGRASKADMIKAAKEIWQVQPRDDNHADVLCLLHCAVGK